MMIIDRIQRHQSRSRDFAKVVGLTHLEDEFGPFVHALDPPFAYFWSPEIATSQSNAVYIAGPGSA